MAVGSAFGFVVCVVLSILIFQSIAQEWGNLNSLQLSLAGLGLAAAGWGVFLFGRYATECLVRSKERQV